MGSRDTNGGRLRSNRLERDTEVDRTPPDSRDAKVDLNAVRQDNGDVGNHAFTVDVEGLEPPTGYWYEAEVDGRRSTENRFVTAPEGAASLTRLAFGSCARTNPDRVPRQPLFARIEAEAPDLLLFVGDNVCFDSQDSTSSTRSSDRHPD